MGVGLQVRSDMETAAVTRLWSDQKVPIFRPSGAAEETRTPDPIITNDVLYQLSYSGTFW